MKLLRVIELITFLCLLPLTSGAGEAQSFSFAVVPQFPATEIRRDWQPLFERLREMTGIEFKLQFSRSISDFEQDFLRGIPDFAFLNPYHAVMAKRSQNYVPLLRDSKPLTGIIVVRSDDPATSVRQLDRRDLAFPAPNAFGASLYLRALLAEEFHIRVTPHYVKTHSNVYRHVIMGETAAGGGVNNTLDHESAEVRGRLRVLYETPGVASHPIVAHPRVPESVRKKLSEALLRLAADPANALLFAAVQLPFPVVADYARDYQPLERLKLERYVVSAEAKQ
jgi:phosphonate transport system substrate-binding protein